MNKMYLDIIEKSLSAYTPQRIRDFIDEVKRDGITEHGFPRLGVNMGTLIAYGRKTEMLDIFIEIMDICCEQIPKMNVNELSCWVGNNFSIREICCCLMLLEKNKAIEETLINKWREQLKYFVAENGYNGIADDSGKFVGNWALFAAVSEYIRGVFCSVDTSEFVDGQIPSQLANLDCNDMYKDAVPWHITANPIVYDMVPRILFAFLLMAGYSGKYAARIEQILDKTADITLKMQSVTGELPFGGRSNQFVHTDTMLCAYFELEATRFNAKGDTKKAGEFKTAATLAAKNAIKLLNLEPISHIKNRYDIDSGIGCEGYGYFNKYMITAASNLCFGTFFMDDSIEETELLNKKTGYVVSTGEAFAKTFLSAGGYFAEIDTNADFYYDANGLGRVHKEGCDSLVCLSVPFPSQPKYTLESENPTGMSICCYAENNGEILLGAEQYAKYTLVKSDSDEKTAEAVFDVKLSDEITVQNKYILTENGVDVFISGYENIGFMLPIFDFDGAQNTNIIIEENYIAVSYGGSVCKYSFEGELSKNFKYYFNRNGKYRVYSVNSKKLHIEIN